MLRAKIGANRCSRPLASTSRAKAREVLVTAITDAEGY